MRDVLPALLQWQAQGHRYAVATVVKTWGSSPRPVGSMMAVRTDGTTVGSVSGGCVESAVTEECLAALQTGEAKALDFGALDDAKAWEVGLSCGGQIVVQVDPLLSEIPVWRLALGKLEADEPCVLVTWLDRHRYELWQPGDS